MKYTWNTDLNADIWYNDEFDTIEDCILDAKENYGIEEGTDIFIGEVVYYELYIDATTILDFLEEDAYEQCGQVAGDWCTYDNIKDELKLEILSDKLTEVIREWLIEYNRYPDFYRIENIQMVEVK